MKKVARFFPAAIAAFALAGCACTGKPVSGQPAGVSRASAPAPTKAQIAALFERWNRSLATGDPAMVVANYAPDAILLPTVSNRVRPTQADRLEYFTHFLEKKPQGRIDRAFIRTYGDIAIDSGIYTFSFKDGSTVPARYTFVYKRQSDGRWLIVEHHSSAMPEQPPAR